MPGRALVALCFGFNLLVALGSKGVLSSYGFGFPLLLTTIHMAFTAVLSNAVSSPGAAGRCAPYRAFGMRRGVLFGVIFVTNIVLNNIALHYVSVSSHQVIRSLTPAFSAVLGFQGAEAAGTQQPHERVTSHFSYAGAVPTQR